MVYRELNPDTIKVWIARSRSNQGLKSWIRIGKTGNNEHIWLTTVGARGQANAQTDQENRFTRA